MFSINFYIILSVEQHIVVKMCASVSICLCLHALTCFFACVSFPLLCVFSCSIFLIAGVLEGQLFDLGAVLGLSTRCAGWSPIMLGWSQTQLHYWLPGRPSHQPRCYTPLTTSLAQFDPPSLLCYALFYQQQEASAGTTGTQEEGRSEDTLYQKEMTHFLFLCSSFVFSWFQTSSYNKVRFKIQWLTDFKCDW